MSSYSSMPALMAAIEYSPKKQQKINKIMEKERKITAPDGCEIKKVEIIDGVAVVTFKEKERKLPKSWEEFCEMCQVEEGESYFNTESEIIEYEFTDDRSETTDRNILPDRATAEAVLALCQLIQLRNAYNGDWVPDWNVDDKKYVIEFSEGKIETDYNIVLASTPIYFKTEELRDEFLRNFIPLIEKLKPLYGIKDNDNQ